ncbi:hypothetical protein [Xylocopilactobacillus apis]|uniref:Uncharacterized protein n=1 Tax=Xylocopilactobacillus apis TaxID=2932183 RepID=A0AAU9CNN2_9LACO|nr:hypothetical protein [Xylocopilactobacillus apis]BDR55544.1 hypothetical protein KIMC2_01060 [Xylocopilactobacillus apis]
MKITKKILIFSSPILILIAVYLVMEGVRMIQYKTAEAKAYQELSTLVPRSKQIKVDVRYSQAVGLELFPNFYEFEVTTKEDYNHWKKIVLKRRKFLGSDDFETSKEKVNDVKYCEITYKTNQTIKKGKPDDDILMVYGDDGFLTHPVQEPTHDNRRHFKTWNIALKHMYDNFAYVPSNQELVKKWKFPAQNVKEMNSYRQSLNK